MNHKNKKNRTATSDNITLVLELINSLHYFTEKVKRDLIIAITEWNNTSRDYPDFAFSLERYMEIRGLTNKKEAIQDITESLKGLGHSSIFVEKDHAKSGFLGINIPIFFATSYIRGFIHYEFTDSFFKLLRDSTSVPFLSGVLLGKQKMNHKEQLEETLVFLESNEIYKKIEKCLISALTKDEKKILRILREEIDEQIQTGEITGSGITIYEAYISYDKFFSLYGVSKDNHKATKPIKDILFGRSSKGLRKGIIVEHQPAISTQLIANIEEVDKKGFDPGFIIVMPSFLFVERENAKDY